MLSRMLYVSTAVGPVTTAVTGTILRSAQATGQTQPGSPFIVTYFEVPEIKGSRDVTDAGDEGVGEGMRLGAVVEGRNDHTLLSGIATPGDDDNASDLEAAEEAR